MMLHMVNLALLTMALVALSGVNVFNLLYLVIVIICIPHEFGTDIMGMGAMFYTQVSPVPSLLYSQLGLDILFIWPKGMSLTA